GTALGDPATALAGTIGRILVPSDGLWRGALYSLEPGAVLIAGSKAGPALAAFPFFAPAPPPLIYLAWALIWNLGAFGLAMISLERRDLQGDAEAAQGRRPATRGRAIRWPAGAA